MAKSVLRISLVLFLLGLLLVVSGCQQQTKEPGGNGNFTNVEFNVLRMGLAEEILRIDPIYVQSYGEMQVMESIYEGLFTLEGETGRVIPLLVEKWEVSPDKTTYTFHLRKGIKFHSGRELVANDVKYSWQRLLLHNKPGELANVLRLIKGAKEYAAGWSQEVSGIVIVDTHLIQINLERPHDQLLLALAHPGAAIVDKQVMELVGDDYGKPGTMQSPLVVLVGTGPFSVVEWIGDEQLVLQAFDQYHGRVPGIDRLEILFYSETESLYTDFMAENLDLVMAHELPNKVAVPENYIHRFPGSGFYYLGVNGEQEPFNNLSARQFISNSLDRGALASRFDGTPLAGLMPRLLYQGRGPRLEYSYEANSPPWVGDGENEWSIAESGVPLIIPPGETWALIGNEIQAQLAKVGVSIILESVPKEELEQRVRNKDFFLFLDFYQSHLPSPLLFFENFFSSWGQGNWDGFADTNVEEKLDFLHSGIDEDWIHLENLLEIEQMVQRHGNWISLWQEERYLAYQGELGEIPLTPLGQIALARFSPPLN